LARRPRRCLPSWSRACPLATAGGTSRSWTGSAGCYGGAPIRRPNCSVGTVAIWGPWFPELTQAAKALPAGTLLDGEIVICDENGWAEFGRLQERLSTARARAREASRQHPAVLVVFDVLAIGKRDMTSCDLTTRRSELAQLLAEIHPCLQLVEQTASVSVAHDWLGLPMLEGVVAKRADRPYVAGRCRDWIKVKRQRTVDCVVMGIAGDVTSPKLVLGLRHTDGQLHHFAVTRPLAAELTGALGDMLDVAGPQQAAIRSRWQHDAIPPWRPVPARLVCEVRVTNLDAERWARFPAAFVRWRPDRGVDDCGLDQLTC
jgi:ATP-dependent DNA ligase